jgi:hypothetical protein
MTVVMIALVGLLFVAGSIAPRYAMAQNASGVDRALNAAGTGVSAEREGQNEVENASGTGAKAEHEAQNEVENATGTGAGAEHEAQNEVQSAPED